MSVTRPARKDYKSILGFCSVLMKSLPTGIGGEKGGEKQKFVSLFSESR
jgi:hypothetical protein